MSAERGRFQRVRNFVKETVIGWRMMRADLQLDNIPRAREPLQAEEYIRYPDDPIQMGEDRCNLQPLLERNELERHFNTHIPRSNEGWTQDLQTALESNDEI